jgi:hypothetical protein
MRVSVLAFVAVVTLVAGCGASTSGKPVAADPPVPTRTAVATTTTTTPPPVTTPARQPATSFAPPPVVPKSATKEDLYISVLRAKDISGDRRQLIDLGKAVCTDLDRGMDFTIIAAQIIKAADGLFDVGDVGTVMGAGVGAFCPEHKDKLPGR